MHWTRASVLAGAAVGWIGFLLGTPETPPSPARITAPAPRSAAAAPLDPGPVHSQRAEPAAARPTESSAMRRRVQDVERALTGPPETLHHLLDELAEDAR